ncbi:MAG TPA: M28 family peptidase [Candidatus Binatia bacterium]|nr:M28 family peptidase [Candidatus Binatia bacterium]
MNRRVVMTMAAAGWLACVQPQAFAEPKPAAGAPLAQPNPSDAALRDRLQRHTHDLAARIGERNASHYGNLELARAYVESEMRSAGYQPRLQSYQHEGRTFHNVEAVLAGAADTPILVVGAHYDSAMGSPGGNDNASGVAVLLELARALAAKHVATPIHFVAFPNEEPPYFNTGAGMGSREYAATFSRPREQIRGMISVETVGYYSDEPGSQRYPPQVGPVYPDKGNFIGFIGNPLSSGFVHDVVARFRAAASLASEVAVLPEEVPGVAWSDHRSFWDRGVPALMVTDTATFRDPHYHRSSDRPERLDHHRMALLTRGLEAALLGMAQGK